MAKPENKVFHVRYITYEIHFPKDKDYWVDQTPFIEHLDWLMNNRVKLPPRVKHALVNTGYCEWKDQNSVTHVIKIEDQARTRKWGTRPLEFKTVN